MTSIHSTLSNLGEIISISRKKEKITQQDLANNIGVSRLTISNIENGKNVTIDNVLKIFKYFYLLDDFNEFLLNVKLNKNKQENNFNLYE